MNTKTNRRITGRVVKGDNGAVGTIQDQPADAEGTITPEVTEQVANVLTALAGGPAAEPAATVTVEDVVAEAIASGAVSVSDIADALNDAAATQDSPPAEAAVGPDAEPVGEPGTQDQPVAVADPFADLPVVTVGEYQLLDLATKTGVANAFKYAAVQTAALQAKAHIVVGWKHSSDMLILGRSPKEFKPSSVYGTIQSIIHGYGRAGVPAYVVAAKLRQLQVGNKRSKYCTELPPIGWAEGWINTFVSKGHGRVMEGTKAPILTAEVAQEIAEGDAAAEVKAQEIAKAA